MADKLAVFVPAERELDRLRQQVPAEGHDDLGLGVGAGMQSDDFSVRSQKRAAERVMGREASFTISLPYFCAKFPMDLARAVAGDIVADLENF